MSVGDEDSLAPGGGLADQIVLPAALAWALAVTMVLGLYTLLAVSVVMYPLSPAGLVSGAAREIIWWPRDP